MFDRVRMGKTFRNDTIETAVDDGSRPTGLSDDKIFFAIDYIPPIELIMNSFYHICLKSHSHFFVIGNFMTGIPNNKDYFTQSGVDML